MPDGSTWWPAAIRFLLTGGAAVLVLLGAPHAADAECRLGAVAVLPEQGRHSPVVTIDINGKPATLVLDTGAFTTTLKLNSAERLGVRMSQLDADSHGVGGVSHLHRGVAGRMRIGGISADGLTLAGVDFFNRPEDAELDGLLGMNLMAAYDVDLDLAGRHVIIYEADGGCSKPTVALAQPLYMVPLEFIENDRQADVELVIDGRRVRAVVDSGAARTVMFRSAGSRLGVDISALRSSRHVGYGVGPRPVPVMEHVFATVRIGDLQINDMAILVLDQANMGLDMVHVGSRLPDPSLGEPGGEEMLLGADFMRKVHLWISHSSHKLIMQYPPQPSVLPR